MASQLDIFGMAGDTRKTVVGLPKGFRYQPNLISPADEQALLACVQELPFRDFKFHGYTGRRRVVSFGWRYDFSGRQLLKADDIPDFLFTLRPAAAASAGMEPEALQHVLVTEYGPGAAIAGIETSRSSARRSASHCSRRACYDYGVRLARGSGSGRT